jgi:serine/threonine protein kinase
MMIESEPSAQEENLVSLLIACDEALAAGESPTSLCDVGAGPDQQPLVQRCLACLNLLHQFWPRRGPDPPAEAVDELAQSGSSTNRIGRFSIRHELGRGGFGVVFLAYDPELRRDVALKVPRADVLITPELRARFHQEAQAAAALDHPNLATVFEAGEVGPVCYIASAYCPGTTLAQWLRQRTEAVPCEDAAQLIRTLADAIQYAHDRGVVHRDLKPANILLQIADCRLPIEKPQRVGPTQSAIVNLQFAIPKITDFGLAKLVGSSIVQTQDGVLLGTPSYMAPEQGHEGTDPVGPGADIYALGVILYELLTGRPPFQAESTLATLMLARETEPVPPSRLRLRLPRDLETICLKCLQKKPVHRYASAGALAEDLDRFLSQEPIRARPVSSTERLARWCRRKPLAAGLLVALILALIGGMIGISWQWRRAEANAALARDERDTASHEKERAEVNFVKARTAVEHLTRLAQQIGTQPGRHGMARAVLEEALAYYQGFLEEKSADPQIRLETARACVAVGTICHDLGQWERSEEAYHQGIRLLERLLKEFPAEYGYRAELTRSYKHLANMYKDTSRQGPAREFYLHAIALGEAHLEDSPNDPKVQSEVANTLVNYCVLAREMREPAHEVERLYARALELEESALAVDPNNFNYRQELALGEDDFGLFLWAQGRKQEAETTCRRALRMRVEIAESFPGVRRFTSYLARSHLNLGLILAGTHRPGEAEAAYGAAIQILNRLVAEYPDIPYYRWQLLDALTELFKLLQAAARSDAAKQISQQMLMQEEKLAADFPDSTESRQRLAGHHDAVGIVLLLAGHEREAIEECHRALKIHPDSDKALNDLAWILVTSQDASLRDPKQALLLAKRAVELVPRTGMYWNTLGVAQYRNGDFKSAAASLQKALPLKSGGNPNDWFFLAMANWQLGARAEARRWYDRALAGMNQVKNPRVSLQRIRAEAEALLGVPGKP